MAAAARRQCHWPPRQIEHPFAVVGPIRWRGQVVFADPGFLLRAHLAYEQTLACGRCLNPIVEPTEADVELMVLVERGADGRGAKGEEEKELHEDDLSLQVIPKELLDTGPILVEQLQLNVPVKALCRPDCQGLCPECGADRNAGACSCGRWPIGRIWLTGGR